jgi:hypothetical protein
MHVILNTANVVLIYTTMITKLKSPDVFPNVSLPSNPMSQKKKKKKKNQRRIILMFI